MSTQRPSRPIPDPIDPTETVAIERQWLPRAGVLALLAGILPLIGIVFQILSSRGVPDDVSQVKTVAGSLVTYATENPGAGLHGRQAEVAAHFGEQAPLTIASAVLTGIGMVLIAPVLYGLLRAAWRRRPSFPRAFMWAPVVGAVLFGVLYNAASIYRAIKLHEFAGLDEALRTNAAAIAAADTVTDKFGGVLIAVPIAQMVLAVGIGAAALSAMNVGLLTRMMGIIGVILAAGLVLQFDQQGFLRSFWLIALGAVLLGKMPGGRPPAWATGHAVPWPSRAMQIEAAERARDAKAAESGAPAPKPKQGGNRKRRK